MKKTRIVKFGDIEMAVEESAEKWKRMRSERGKGKFWINRDSDVLFHAISWGFWGVLSY